MRQTPAWDEELLANPHRVADKRQRVQKMFAAIAPSYDLNNRLHSLWMDQRWRKQAVKLAQLKPTDRVVDVACGTGDLAMKFRDRLTALHETSRLPAPSVVGVDFTFEMLPLAKRKARLHVPEIAKGPLGIDPCVSWIQWINGDAMALPLPDECTNVVSIAFGIRNVADPAAAIREFFRVLRLGGRLIILEFSLPTNPVLRGLYNFYFRKILPRTATWISQDRTGAYKYLPESVNTFIGRGEMVEMMQAAGFSEVEQFPMTFGICICYRGLKK